jgi:AcrR family transcriptional regulator
MVDQAVRQRRRYDSPLRRERAAETRARIISAGAEMLRGFPVWDWRALTVRGVAHRAGVNERTVSRYFPTERDLRDAVMAHQEQASGVDLDGLELDDLQEVVARTFRFVSSFPLEPRTPRDPTLVATNARQRQALLTAVAPWTEDWPSGDRAMAAGMLDVLWSVVSYERLVAGWELDSADAIRAISWVIGLVEDGIRRGVRPETERQE